MNTPAELRERCAAELLSRGATVRQLKTFVGLDGFVDEIVHLVDSRQDAVHYQRLPTLTSFGRRVLGAAGQSTNVEGVVQTVKLGGNGPIMANALAALGAQVTYLGAVGWPTVHPVFQELVERATVYGLAEPGHTDALEFEDGKLMITKTVSLNEVTWENLRGRFGVERMRAHLAGDHLVAFVNWTMIPNMSAIWRSLLEEACVALPRRDRLLFFDLADPQKRLPADLRQALELIGRFGAHFQTVLGLNEKETWEVATVLGLDTSARDREALEGTSRQIAARVRVRTLVVHPVSHALAVRDDQLARVEGPFEPNPKITTGAGDHFNAGFCLGLLLGFDLPAALLIGVGASGFYVRQGRSPNLSDVAQLLRQWPASVSA